MRIAAQIQQADSCAICLETCLSQRLTRNPRGSGSQGVNVRFALRTVRMQTLQNAQTERQQFIRGWPKVRWKSA